MPPWASPCARRAGDVAPYQGRGQDAGHGRGRRPRRPASPCAFPKASPCARRAGDVAPYQGRGQDAGHGRGRRPRRPASPCAFPKASPCAWRAGDVAPYHGRGQDAGHGRGRRPRRPASPMASPWVPSRPRGRSRWRPRGRGAPGTSRPTRGAGRMRGLVGADVPGGPRSRVRPRWRSRGCPRVPVGVPDGVPVCAARGNVSLPRICNFCFIGIGLAEARRG